MRTQVLLWAVASAALWPAATSPPDSPATILGAAPSCHVGAPPAGQGDAPPKAPPGLASGFGQAGYAVEIVRGGPDGEAGRYFAQGVRLDDAFNEPEAIRAFQWAQVKDPDCALCAWGEAQARGPTINYPVEGKDAAAARKAALDAQRLAALSANADLSPKARGLIAAEVARHPSRWGKAVTDNGAYAKAMEALAARFPNDDAIAIETASALMIAAQSDQDGWRGAATDPRSNAGRARVLIEKVIARSPTFAPALHFQIHLMEGAGEPKVAEVAADRLGKLAPGAGHLIHMPSPIYYRLGRYEDAATANARASAADVRYVAELNPPGGMQGFALHGHNVSFGLGGALMSGDGPGALAFAKMAQETFKPGGPVHARGYFAYARYAPPAQVLALAKPPAPVDEALWRYARGEAHARQGDAAGVEAEAQAIAGLQKAAAAKLPEPAKPYVEIARLMLVGRAAMLRERWPQAIAALSKASDLRDKADQWPDPPGWGFPPRRTLAAARLLSGDAAGAERELGKSLAFEPNDPLALYVMSQARGRSDPAAGKAYRAAADRGWRGDPKAMRLELI